MSASLVGSEMCIRDRAVRCSELRTSRPGGPKPLKAPGRRWRSSPSLRSCLLYTSDAADDM
eukprot:3104744-Alexandrium_andersonii.AAC.1